MPASKPGFPSLDEILTSRRMADAFGVFIDQWDHAEPDDRVAGLLLFREITVGERRRQSRNFGRSSGPGLSR